MVGQNLGAGKPDRAEKSGWFAVGLAQGYAMLIALIILLWAENIISVFNSDPEVMDIAGTFLRIAAAGYMFMGLYFVLQNAINGSGDTLPPMLITLLIFGSYRYRWRSLSRNIRILELTESDGR